MRSFLQPGLAFNFAGNGTLSTGEDTAGASLMSTL
ncbi:MAG: hypothetical protein CM15mP109_11080 [Candidatus Dadabacteria bacterium]|nr:MAG: hypothetical protein CM15mP109_11080 [Candidatus Dadabacteria bacterium]